MNAKCYATILAPAFMCLLAVDRACCQAPCEQFRIMSYGVHSWDRYGRAIDAEDDTLVIGAPSNDNGPGAVYVFQFDGRKWIEKQKLVASDGQDKDRFGATVSLEGDWLMVGAEIHAAADAFSGAVYAFYYVELADTWVQMQELSPHDAQFQDGFGNRVDMCGDTLAVGADSVDPGGAVYIYEYDGVSWIEGQKLSPSDVEDNDGFGKQLDLEGDVLVIGSDSHIHDGDEVGGAYVFRRQNNGVWIEEQELFAPNGRSMGEAVALSGDLIASGVGHNDNAEINKAGIVFLYQFDGESWILRMELLAPDAATDNQLGTTLLFDGDLLAIDSKTGVYLYDSGRAGGSPWLRKLINSANGVLGSALAINRANLFASESIGGEIGAVDVFDIATPNTDCNGNLLIDECETATGLAPDCNANENPDACDITAGFSEDCDENGVPDECDPDCDANGVPDVCDIADGNLPDCNDNLIPDQCDIASGFSDDVNGNGIPDECDEMLGDLNLDGVVDGGDLLFLLGFWGPCPKPPFECQPDLDGDGVVGPSDLIILLGNWGQTG